MLLGRMWSMMLTRGRVEERCGKEGGGRNGSLVVDTLVGSATNRCECSAHTFNPTFPSHSFRWSVERLLVKSIGR
jgi:hypothetical protein